MGNPRRIRWIQRIHVKRNISRPSSFQCLVRWKAAHFEYFDAEALGLLSLMSVEGSNSCLHQSPGQPRFHNARERTGMREAISLKLVIQIGVRIEMKDRQRRMFFGYSRHDRISNRMISTQRHRAPPIVNQFTDGSFNRSECIRAKKFKIPRIFVNSFHTKIHPRLCPVV